MNAQGRGRAVTRVGERTRADTSGHRELSGRCAAQRVKRSVSARCGRLGPRRVVSLASDTASIIFDSVFEYFLGTGTTASHPRTLPNAPPVGSWPGHDRLGAVHVPVGAGCPRWSYHCPVPVPGLRREVARTAAPQKQPRPARPSPARLPVTERRANPVLRTRGCGRAHGPRWPRRLPGQRIPRGHGGSATRPRRQGAGCYSRSSSRLPRR